MGGRVSAFVSLFGLAGGIVVDWLMGGEGSVVAVDDDVVFGGFGGFDVDDVGGSKCATNARSVK